MRLLVLSDVHGNCGCSQAFAALSQASRRHTRSILGPEDLSALGSLPTELEFAFGEVSFYLTHATPRDNLFEYASPDKDPAQWAEAMSEALARCPAVILAGHTHRPYLAPRDGDPRASYAVWTDGRWELKRVSYDVALTQRRLAGTGLAPEVVAELGRVLETGAL